MFEHVFAIKSIAFKDKQDENIMEVKLEMNINDEEDLSFAMELLRLKQLPLVNVSFESSQKALPFKEGTVAAN